MASQTRRDSSEDETEEILHQFRNNSTSIHQNAAALAEANELDTTSVSGPRARKPPTRLVDEIALQNDNAGSTMDDPEYLTSEKDDHEAEDPDYKESNLEQKPQDTLGRMENSASRVSVNIHGPSPDWEAKYNQARRELLTSKNVSSELRKKRTEDRKQGAMEKAERIRLEKVVKYWVAERTKLGHELDRAKEHFEERLEQQQNDFNKAQAAMTKLVQKNETFTIPDDIVRDSLQSLKAEWKSWAKEYSNAAFQDCPNARIRDLINKTTLNKTALQQETILQILAAKQSGSAICLNALLAFDVCEKTFGEPFLSLLALEGGQDFKKMSTKFLHTSTKGDPRMVSLWRAQTLQLADFQGWNPAQEDLPAHLANREARFQQHYEGLAANFLDRVAVGMFKLLDELEVVKRKDELQSLYREAGKLSIRLWKQTTHPRLDINYTLQDQFSRRSVSMQPHSSMLLDEDDNSCDGKSPDMIIEPGLFAYGDAYGQNYDMRKNWMKATVLLFNQPLELSPKALNQAEAPKLTGQKLTKHQIKFEDDENGPQTKRTKKNMPPGDFGEKVSGEFQRSAAIAQSKPGSNAPQTEPSNTDAKAVTQKTSTVDVHDPNERNRGQKATAMAQNLSKAEPDKQTAESKPVTYTQRTTTTSKNPRAPAPKSLRATMVNQSTIPQMAFLNEMLADVAQPKPRDDVWERQESKTREATAIQKEAEKSAAKRRASMTTTSYKKPAGLYHENATTAGSTAPENPPTKRGRDEKHIDLTKGDD